LNELTSRTQLLEGTDAWHLRSAGSNAGSSVPSPPGEDPSDFDEYSSYPAELLHRSYDLRGPAHKVSPTSSTAADADVDTDHDAEWDPMPSLEVGDGRPSPNESYSDIGKPYEWEEMRTMDNPFSDLNGGFEDDIMDTRDYPQQKVD